MKVKSRPLFITGNQSKADYIASVTHIDVGHKKIDLDEIQSVDPREVVEHKVRQAYSIVGVPVLVEDASLGFAALDGLPGPFVKFFASSKNGYETMCRMLDSFDDRSAAAVVTYGYYDGDELTITSGELKGFIVDSPKGDGGFGWDTIFSAEGDNGLTLAQLTDDERVKRYQKMRNIAALAKVLSG